MKGIAPGTESTAMSSVSIISRSLDMTWYTEQKLRTFSILPLFPHTIFATPLERTAAHEGCLLVANTQCPTKAIAFPRYYDEKDYYLFRRCLRHSRSLRIITEMYV